MPTLRTEFHRLAPGTATATVREAGSSVFQVFQGSATVTVAEATWSIERGDLFVVPSWQPLTVEADQGVDLFRFSDSPIFERLLLHRTETKEAAR